MSIAVATRFEPAALVDVPIGTSWSFAPLDRETACALEADWQDLALNASEPNIFMFPDFIRASLPLLKHRQAHLLAIRCDGVLLGVAILRRDWGYAKLPVPFYRTALHHEQFLGTPLVRKGREREFARGLFDWLDNAQDAPVFVNLAQCSANGAIAEAVMGQAAQEGRASFSVNRFQRAAIVPAELPQGEEPKWLSNSRRKSLRKARRNLDKVGEASIERLGEQEDIVPWIAGFLAMEDTGWKHENGSSILSCANETGLYDKLIRCAHRAGTLNFARLCVDGKPIAYTLDILAAPLGFCIKSAIHQDYRRYSPGLLLEVANMEHYRDQSQFELLDSCTSSDNAVLNELWPHRKTITDLLVGRKGRLSSALFSLVMWLKRREISEDRST